MRRVCPECEKLNRAGSVFCRRCGATLEGGRLVTGPEPLPPRPRQGQPKKRISQPTHPPAAREEPRRERRIALIGAAVLALCLLGTVASAVLGRNLSRATVMPIGEAVTGLAKLGQGQAGADAPQAQPTRPPKPTPVVVKLGEQAQVDNWQFRVTEVQWHKALYFLGKKDLAEGIWCVLFLDIENQASEPARFGNLWWQLRGAEEQVFDRDSGTFSAVWQFEGRDTPWDEVPPGESAQIVMAFEVAESARELTLYSDRLDQTCVLMGDAQPPQDR